MLRWPGARMKITLDISKLVEEGKLTAGEAERLKALAASDTGSLGINILVGFGVIAVAAGIGALVPDVWTALILGAVIFGLGAWLTLGGTQQWRLLAQICTVLGALTFCGAVAAFGKGSLATMLIVVALLTGAALLARSSLLIAAAVLVLGSCLGAKAGYWHATYALAIYEPLLTILLFAALALAAYLASARLPADYERLAIASSRTSVVMVNFGFWIGSLWGDRLLLLRGLTRGSGATTVIPDYAFSIGWAAALIAAGAWAVAVNRRWLVNVVAVFGAIHFYTQWFERLGASPLSVLGGGLIMLAIALALWRFNKVIAAPDQAAVAKA
jgi:iron complex transport system permease protein